ncbi:MAG: tetratricopeptide repeat protein [Burkholderiales bacterium]|nr:tetratricopeptide repeat protein [Burkholderiales bacterium]
MARTARIRTRTSRGWPALEAAIVARLRTEPSTRSVTVTVALLVVALYGTALGYPLVFADFALLSAQQLGAYARALPAPGGNWLADASFGWSGFVFGTNWPWHRMLNLAAHGAATLFAFALFRRILTGAGATGRIASGWIAFVAALLFALHPVAIYTVAYLSARYALLLGLFALVALWSTARSLQDGGRAAWAIGPIAMAVAVACSPGALAIPAAMALLVLTLPAAGAAEHRRAWLGVALAGLIAAAYATAWVAEAPESGAGAGAYLDGLAASSWRILRYLGFWLVPWTARMAIDMPEPAISAGAIWPGWLAIVVQAMLALGIAWILRTRRTGLARAAGIGIGCALVLISVQAFWPRLDAPFALARSYAWMPCVALAPACGLALLPSRAAWIAACTVIVLWIVLAADTLQTFSSHVALWDDAVRRTERVGPRPQDARVYLNRATVHRHDGHTLAALDDYDRALALQPAMTRALRGRAQVYIDEKRYGEALRDFDRLLELDPAQAITHADRGLALMQAGRLDEAGHAFDRAIRLGAKEPRVFLNRALTRLQLGCLGAANAALADIERALKLDPAYALAYYNRAMIFEQAANAGIRLRDALSPELMRAVADQNLSRACELGLAGACERLREKSKETLPGAADAPLRMTPEALRQQASPSR